MTTKTLRITGMTCESCASSVEKALNALPGVKASVSYSDQLARVEGAKAVSDERLIEAVEASGYGANLVEDYPKRAMMNGRGSGLHVAIIGSGSAAFACAIRLADEGARVTLIESGTVGGTCVNTGCVPSKILIRSAQLAHWQQDHPFAGLGKPIPAIDRRALVAQQQARVEELRQAKYLNILEEQPNITLVRGFARFTDPKTLSVKRDDSHEERLTADRILIATGATPVIHPIPGLKETPFWTSTEALVAEEIPQHLIILGGSFVGLEIGQAFLHLGAKVTLIGRSSLLSRLDPDIGPELQRILEGEGARILTGTEVKGVRHDGRQFSVDIGSEMITGDRLLVASGRRPNTAGLDLAKAGIEIKDNGAVLIDDHMRTTAGHIYAAGDCTTQPHFVYVAAAAGTRVATNMLGGDAALDLSSMPAVMFTDPQVATVGLTDAQAQARGIQTESRTLTLDNVPRALVNFDTRGFIKVVAEKESGRLLGAHVLAAEGGEIIQAAVLALHNRMTVQELAEQLFPYLTMVEGIKLCAQTFTQDVKQLSCCAG